MRWDEVDRVRTLDIVIPENHPGKKSPFSSGKDIDLYTEQGLKKQTKEKLPRNDWFEKRLLGIRGVIGGPIPYAFRTKNGELRSMDAGCLGFLFNRPQPEVELRKGSDGFVTEVELVGDLLTKYNDIEWRLIAEVRNSAAAPDIAFVESTTRTERSSEDTLLADIDAIKKDATVPDETTRRALVDARLGQGAFRKALMQRWTNACAASACGVSEVLRASHIKSWRLSSNTERLDRANGLLLIANIDALFDKGLVTFNDGGSMVISSRLPETERRRLGLPKKLRLTLTPTEKEFLTFHRESVFN
jgi:hypothetical protein